MKKLLTGMAFCLVCYASSAQAFIHPGILHSGSDLDRMRKAVANKEEPVYSGYQLFSQNPASQFDYNMRGPLAAVGRNPTVGQNEYDNDANAAHQNAVMWAITGDKRYANKAVELVNAWSSRLKAVTGRDAVLMAGLGPFKMVNAAEILRYTNTGWKEADIKKTEKHFKEVIYPVIKDFAPFANGNWDAAAIKTVMAIGVFCNDRAVFERGIRYYVNGHGNGRITHYVINEEGQVQESGRDQGHTQLGIGLLAECCAIAWNQGLDLYGYADNRLLKGFEYVAKFNLGNEVPFQEWLDRTGKYHHTSIAKHDRGPLRAVYEQVYNHFVHVKNLSAPYTQLAAEKIRPEGPGKPGADHPGYGTLFFITQAGGMPMPAFPAAPAGVVATGNKTEVKLHWVCSVAAASYTIKRSVAGHDNTVVVAKHVTGSSYTDSTVKPGVIYHYSVAATNANGEGVNSCEVSVAAGLPIPWHQHTIGNMNPKGTVFFDGNCFTIEGVGRGLDSIHDEAHFTWQTMNGDGEIMARFAPQPSSQFSQMGISIREELDDDGRQVSLLIYPGKTGQVEAPDWHVRWLKREHTGDAASLIGHRAPLHDRSVTWGRLTGHLWLRLQRKGNYFISSYSYDGRTWTRLGTAKVELKKDVKVGLIASSGMSNSTTVLFDRVAVQQ